MTAIANPLRSTSLNGTSVGDGGTTGRVRVASHLGGRTTPDVIRWFPSTPYYENHASRIAYSCSALPKLPRGFSCLCLGSWGAEVPFLKGCMGAGRVVCVRAPEEGVPNFEERRIVAPHNLGEYSTTSYALDLQQDELPRELSGFDLVLCWELLEHLRDNPSFMVWQAIRSLKTGGYISLTTPNALWHCYTTAQLYGTNALGLRLQPHRPFATHWRLYSPAEVAELCTAMSCRTVVTTSFLGTEPFSFRSRLFLALLRLLRRRSGNGECTYGQHVYVLARKDGASELYRPDWLFPKTCDKGGRPQLATTVGESDTPLAANVEQP
jgi:SAM-dependent methyltransferase